MGPIVEAPDQFADLLAVGVTFHTKRWRQHLVDPQLHYDLSPMVLEASSNRCIEHRTIAALFIEHKSVCALLGDYSKGVGAERIEEAETGGHDHKRNGSNWDEGASLAHTALSS